jgi:hypothetical protein
LDELEEITCKVRDAMGKAMIKELTQAEADFAQEKELEEGKQTTECRKCKGEARIRGKRVRVCVTMAGVVRVIGRSYYCRACKCCTVPIDVQLKLPERTFTRKVERWVACLSAQVTFVGASNLLSDLGGVDVSSKQTERIAIEMGKWVEEKLKEDVEKVLPKSEWSPDARDYRPEALGVQLNDPDYTACVFMDGAQTPTKGGWKETKTGAVCVTKGLVVRKEDGPEQQPELIKRLYVQHLGAADQFGELLLARAARAGICKLARQVVLGDGAAWIWNIASGQFPHAQQILDWYHAAEHLYEVVRVCLANQGLSPEQLSKRVEQVVKPIKQFMWDGHVDKVIGCIQRLKASTEEARECIRQTTGYFTNNRKRMQYAEYRAKGFWVGSGQAESACKRIVTARLKGTGMRWSEAGAQAVGHLRALFISDGLWDSIMAGWPGTRRRCAAAS